MKSYLFDQKETVKELTNFFKKEKPALNSFGSTVNQTFEANIFAKTIQWYQKNSWKVTIVNPTRNGGKVFILKFNTRGKPVNYSYATCSKGKLKCQIRHGLRVNTASHKAKLRWPANIVCDIAIIENEDLENYTTDSALPNDCLYSFGEVKHMSAFAELIANFIGMAYELTPSKLKRIRIKKHKPGDHLPPFLYVSGMLYKTAKGIDLTIKNRKFDIDIYSHENPLK